MHASFGHMLEAVAREPRAVIAGGAVSMTIDARTPVEARAAHGIRVNTTDRLLELLTAAQDKGCAGTAEAINAELLRRAQR